MSSVDYFDSAASNHGQFRWLSGGSICLASALVVILFFGAAYVYFA